MSDEKRMLHLYVAATTAGVHLFTEDPETKERKQLFVAEPEFARDIAQNLTLRSFACEDLRREKNVGGGG